MKEISPQLFVELDKFRNVQFRDDIHKYYIDGIECPISVTGLIGKYHESFYAEYWSDRKAKEYGVDRETVLRVWKYLNDLGITEGSCLHNFAELYNNNKILPYPEKHVREVFGGIDPIRSTYLLMEQQFRKFHADTTNKLIPIKSELVVGDREWMIGGMIDQLYWNPKAKEYQIWDWKTNGVLDMSSQYPMLDPIEYLADCNYIHYCIQLSLYKLILEKNTNIKIGSMYVVWFNERNPNYVIIPMKDFRKECLLIVNDYLKSRAQNL